MAGRIIRLNETPANFGQVPDDLNPLDFDSDVPEQHTQIDFENESLGWYVGVWDTTEMKEVAGPYPCDEFMWVLSGQVEILSSQTKEKEIVKAGEAFIIPKGFDCQWIQKGYLKKFFVISENEPSEDELSENELAIKKLAEIEPSETTPSKTKPSINFSDKPVIHYDSIIRPQLTVTKINRLNGDQFSFKGKPPLQKDNVCYQNSDHSFVAGTLESEAFETKWFDFPFNKFVFIDSGSLTLLDEQKQSFYFQQGEAFYIEKGTFCSWLSEGELRIFYAEQHH